MLAAIEGSQRFDPERGVFANWLFGIASRQVSTRKRYSGRFQRLLERAREPEQIDDNPLAEIVRGDDAGKIREHIQRLPERDRELILLRRGAEPNSTEIGTAVGMNAGAVRVRLMRIVQRLGDELGGERRTGDLTTSSSTQRSTSCFARQFSVSH